MALCAFNQVGGGGANAGFYQQPLADRVTRHTPPSLSATNAGVRIETVPGSPIKGQRLLVLDDLPSLPDMCIQKEEKKEERRKKNKKRKRKRKRTEKKRKEKKGKRCNP